MHDVPEKPSMQTISSSDHVAAVQADHPTAGTYFLYAAEADSLLFTDNETNAARVFGGENGTHFVKDAFQSIAAQRQKLPGSTQPSVKSK